MVTDAVVNSTVFQTSKYISCYLSMPKGELETAPLVSAILAAGSYHFPSRRRNELQDPLFQERSFTSQSWTPQSRLTRGWTCSACTTSLISIHFRLVSGVSASPRTKRTANGGQTVGLDSPALVCSPPRYLYPSFRRRSAAGSHNRPR